MSKSYEDLKTNPNVHKLCNNQLFIDKETGKTDIFFKPRSENSLRHYWIRNIDDVIQVDYVDSVNQIEIKTQEAKSGAGAAVAGGILFGGIGLVAGALSGRKDAEYSHQTRVTECGFRIFFNDGSHETYNLLRDVYKYEWVAADHNCFKECSELATSICLMISQYSAGINKELSAQKVLEQPEVAKLPPTSKNLAHPENNKSEGNPLLKYADLLEKGLITREDFDILKAKAIADM